VWFNSYRNGLGGDRGDGGFTMIELIIVVAVVGILASIVIFALGSQQATALRGACATDASVILTAQEAHRTLEGSFAPDVETLVPDFIRYTPQNSSHYVITTDTSGTVYVAPAGGSPVPATVQPNPCSSIT
jgi:prepilin-type N-terminal cleavage/methylation domain-containing protein